ncbi:DEBR0S1_20142g1_1 [Brettanomyces bruxellensis]|uniref:non-specific serine/threonine protein kinase n=1 Tax=Dekkera bruxellensis TaxID=5007 RepID=A0A7D9CYJ0_DEKBR|nr:DEBR0S1_20142g1_1 [Brettanomyces bruxellensis]
MSEPVPSYQPGTVLTVGSHQVVIDKYVARGGFAEIYTCRMSPAWNNQTVGCLKRVAVPTKPQLNKLRQEVDAMRRLEGNKYIVSYIDSHASHASNGQGYVVFMLMEYCTKKGLIDFMNTRLVNKLTEPEIINIIYDITYAVACVHSLDPPLIHRDIKIENVLLADDGTFKLCDFGSACPPMQPPRNLEEFQVMQNDILHNTTPQYRCPEMVDLYKRQPIDEKSDIWALGVMLYKLCYYTTPFESNTINGSRNAGGGNYAIVNGIFSFPPAPPFSARLKNVISKTLAVDPNARPDAFQLLEELCKMKGEVFPKQFAHRLQQGAPVYAAKASVEPSTNHNAIPAHSVSSGALPRFSGLVSRNTPVATRPAERWCRSVCRASQLRSWGAGVANSGSDMHLAQSYQHILPSSQGQQVQYTQQAQYIQHSKQGPYTQRSKQGQPKLLDSQSQTATSRSRYPPDLLRRPLSMSATDYEGMANGSSAKSRIVSPIESIITGMTEEETVELSPGHPPNIDSSVQFLRDVSANNTDSSSNSSPVSKRSSISSLRDLLTGGRFSSRRRSSHLSRHSSSSSRISSYSQREKSDGLLDFSRSHIRTKKQPDSNFKGMTDNNFKNMADNNFKDMADGNFKDMADGNSKNMATSISNPLPEQKHHRSHFQTRHSFESHLHAPPKIPKLHPPKKPNSIQWRVKELLGRKKTPAPKTANGYGKYTDRDTKLDARNSPGIDLVRRKSLVESGLPKLSISDVEQADPFALPDKTKHRNEHRAKSPPPKPKKPAYLRRLSLKGRPQAEVSGVDQIPASTRHERAVSGGSSLYNEDFEVLEKKFERKYPSAI